MSKILSSGKYVPSRIVTNDDLSKIVDTSDEWISKRTGIKERRFAQDGENTSDMAAAAILDALSKIDADVNSLDAIILATTTPDLKFPSVACLVQKKIGAKNAFCMDIQAVCSGFIYALSVANNFIKSGMAKRVAVVGSDKMSSIINMRDRNTCVLFGDGAGCVIIEESKSESVIIDIILKSNGSLADILKTDSENHVLMNGIDVFKYAISEMESGVLSILDKNGFVASDLSLVFAHQANKRIILHVAQSLSLDESLFPMNLDRYGNTSAASIPLVFDENFDRLKRGDLIAMSAVGGGMTSGTALIRF